MQDAEPNLSCCGKCTVSPTGGNMYRQHLSDDNKTNEAGVVCERRGGQRQQLGAQSQLLPPQIEGQGSYARAS